MGRGRAKAKQTKVARELKYHTLDTDFSALQRELGGSSGHGPGDGAGRPDEVAEVDEVDPYAPGADDDEDERYVPSGYDEDVPSRRGR